MAFEVFDDVAFYWFLMSVLIAVLLPLSYSFIKNEILGLVTPRKDWTWNLTSCRAKNYQLANKRRTETIYTFWDSNQLSSFWVGSLSSTC